MSQNLASMISMRAISDLDQTLKATSQELRPDLPIKML
ncbi:MAG: hypothetical protein RL146_862, partial [Actinomycetota bacterium]